MTGLGKKGYFLTMLILGIIFLYYLVLAIGFWFHACHFKSRFNFSIFDFI